MKIENIGNMSFIQVSFNIIDLYEKILINRKDGLNRHVTHRKNKEMSFKKIIEKYRKISFSEHDKGERFERLMQAYLKTDPKYAYRFKNVWLWNEFPSRTDLGGSDTGIDLVALTHEGDYWAVQCKCYHESSVIDKPAVDSFLSTSGRKFKNDQLQTTGFTQRLWISTTNKWGSNATEAIKNQNPPVTRINLYDLIQAPVDWGKLDKGISGDVSRITDRELKPHQKEALEKTHEHFKSNDRGKLIMACGTGKTFNSLRIGENETNNKGLILFLVPSIALLSQTLREWTAFAKEPINAICICSDPKVSRKKTKNDDNDNFSVIDLALPASTNVKDIVQQFDNIRKKDKPGMTVVFSTYQSIDVIIQTQQELLKQKKDYANLGTPYQFFLFRPAFFYFKDKIGMVSPDSRFLKRFSINERIQCD